MAVENLILRDQKSFACERNVMKLQGCRFATCLMTSSASQENSAFRRQLTAWVRWSARNPFQIATGTLLIALVAVAVSSRIRVDGDLAALLPSGPNTIRALEETRKRFGSADLFTISIVASDPTVVAKVQDQLRTRMVRDWPFIQTIQIERDQKFFRHRALLFLPQAQLEKI